MPAKHCKRQLFVAGAGLRGTGYPNAWNTIELIRQQNLAEVIDYSQWLPEGTQLWKITEKGNTRAGLFLAGLFFRNAFSLLRLVFRSPARSLTYVPYPGIIFLWLSSWIPERWRPLCICDAYITLWDTIYQDRNLGHKESKLSRALLCIEARALRTAHRIVTDTCSNAAHIADLFKAPRTRLLAFPLAIPAPFTHSSKPSNPSDTKHLKVLFIGTFVPLQGTTVIAEAIHALRNKTHIGFTIIGNGQDAEATSKWLEKCPSATWIRDWQPEEVLEHHMATADICLGIFGGDGKASRVLPFKLYMALAGGKAIITQDTYGTPCGTPAIPALTCTPTPEGLAEAIVNLSEDEPLRRELQSKARAYYEAHLSSPRLAEHWQTLLTRSSAP